MEPFVHWRSWLVWGLVGTLVLTLVTEGAQGLRLTRMSLPYVVGSMLTGDRDRARLLGAAVHFGLGLLFAFLYIAVFHLLGGATWSRGLILGALHAAFVLVVLMRLLPGLHPRMASEHQQPTEVRRLEPPGFLGLHYGRGTPLAILVAHLVFGGTLGAFYSE